MEKNSTRGYAVLGIAVGLGILSAGLSMSIAFYNTRVTERYVTVKGLALRPRSARCRR